MGIDMAPNEAMPDPRNILRDDFDGSIDAAVEIIQEIAEDVTELLQDGSLDQGFDWTDKKHGWTVKMTVLRE